MNIVRESLWTTLHELIENKKPNWRRVNGSWVQAWVQSGGTPIEKHVQALGAWIRRRDREAVIREIGLAIRMIDEESMPEAA